MKRPVLILLVLGCVLGALAGCGQKGPLSPPAPAATASIRLAVAID